MSTKVEADGLESVVDWQPRDLVPHPVNDDFEPAEYARRLVSLPSAPQVRLAFALAFIAVMVAAFDLLKTGSGL